jgi:hypothetical protein
VIKFVSDLRQIGGFLRVVLFPPPIKLTATIYLIEVMIGKKTPFTCIYFFYFQIERDWKFIAMVIDRLFVKHPNHNPMIPMIEVILKLEGMLS